MSDDTTPPPQAKKVDGRQNREPWRKPSRRYYNIRCNGDHEWLPARERAQGEGTDLAKVLQEFVRAYGRDQLNRSAVAPSEDPLDTTPRIALYEDSEWLPAKERAEREGTTMSEVIRDILRGYGEHRLHLVITVKDDRKPFTEGFGSGQDGTGDDTEDDTGDGEERND